MDFNEYLSKKKSFQKNFLDYINDEENCEENYDIVNNLINEHEIKEDINEFRLFLHFIDAISNNHYRTKNFFQKIEKIILLFKEEFQKYLLNDEIFNFFKNNKRILLFLIKNKILKIDNLISPNFAKLYPKYFCKEIKEFESIDTKVLDDPNYEENREKGENEEIYCELIRNDSIEDFITYVNKNELPLETTIEQSVYETNPLLMKESISLIQYAAFFGSEQIFKYLYLNDVELTPSLWIYSIHGKNPEIISILEQKKIEPEDKSYKQCLKTAIECHHNDVVNYIESNFSQKQYEIDDFIIIHSTINYNYILFSDNLFNQQNFGYFCSFDYFNIVKYFLEHNIIDINLRVGGILKELSCLTTYLINAISSDNYDIFRILLEQPEIDVNIKKIRCIWNKMECADNCLFYSVLQKPKYIKILLENKNIDVNAISTAKQYLESSTIRYYEKNPLNHATLIGNKEILKMLLSHPNIDVNIKLIDKLYYSEDLQNNINYFEITPLKTAIMKNHYEIVKILLDHPNIDVNLTSYSNSKFNKIYTPLLFAINYKKIDIVKLLLDHPNIDVNKICLQNGNEVSPLSLAITKSQTEIVSLLLKHPNINVNLRLTYNDYGNKETRSLLSKAIKSNNLDIIQLLLKHKDIYINNDFTTYECPNEYYWEKSILTLSVGTQDNDDLVNTLLNHPGIDTNIRDYHNKKNGSIIKRKWFFHNAIKCCNINTIEKILNNTKIDVNVKTYKKKIDSTSFCEEEFTAMYYVIKYKRLDVIQRLISKENFDFNLCINATHLTKTNFFGEEKTSLHFAIVKEDYDIIKLLLNYLMKNKKLTDNLRELMNITQNQRIKSIIYSKICRKSQNL